MLAERDEAQSTAAKAHAMQASANSALTALKLDLYDTHARMHAERVEAEAMAESLEEVSMQLHSAKIAYGLLEERKACEEAKLQEQLHALMNTSQVLQVRNSPICICMCTCTDAHGLK